ncbi:MAG: Gfo/Idh/MocA family oxidoreductase, partial [Armatimonadota bacterium]|nr:Gfo/Idh/MocA family oxidoreductase [Armatimonadota bacterium]
MRKKDSISRRDFLKGSAASAVLLTAGAAQFAQGAWAAGSDVLRIGVIGCGGRGTGAAINCIETGLPVKIVALGDLFQDRLDSCFKRLTEDEKLKGSVDITRDRCFTGFDNYLKVINAGVDMVILASPPGFRPSHLKAAVEAGKHVFMEKPVAVDAPGVRTVIECGEIASKKGLGIVAGTQRRHQLSYIETIKRIHEGAIGDIVSGT